MAITNGVHAATWIGRPIRRLYERATARSLGSDAPGPEAFAKLADVLESDLWGAHRQQKRELIEFTRSRLARQFARHGESPGVLRELHAAFDPETLIIGFARRFATYKRADLLFHDEHRLAHLLADSERPVQLVLAGKAHPADRPGQQVIQRIFTLSRTEPLRGRIFILEDYDMRIARFLVGGVDIWLNNPRRPMEASGQPLWPWDTGFGVVISHGSGVQSWYWHLKAQVIVQPGQHVSMGQVIGYEGNTGNSTGCHLHFAINDHGIWENPRVYLP